MFQLVSVEVDVENKCTELIINDPDPPSKTKGNRRGFNQIKPAEKRAPKHTHEGEASH